MRVLYVEDNPDDAELTVRQLRRLGAQWSVEIATSVADALARLSAGEAAAARGEGAFFDIVLSDVRLPDGSGMQVLSHIRSRGLPLAVVMLIDSGDEETVLTALRAGADDSLVKADAHGPRLAAVLQDAHARFQAGSYRSRRPLRVLYAEHNPQDADLIRRHFAEHAIHIHLEVVRDAQAVLARLPTSGPATDVDVLLLDYRLLGISALDALKEIRQVRGLDVPIILTTGQGSEDVALRAIQLGAADSLVKDDNYLSRLPTVVENAFYRAQWTREREALSNKVEMLNKIIDNAPVMLSFIDSEGHVVMANRELERVIGWTIDEIAKHPDFLGALYPDPVYRHEVMDFIRQGTGTFREFRIRARDGRAVTARFANVLLSDGTSIGIGLDITASQQTEEALRTSEEHFRQVVETIQEVFWITDPTKRTMIYISPGYERIWGRSCESLYASPRTWLEAIHSDDRARIEHAAATKQTRGDYDEQYRILRPDGAVRWVRDRAFPVRDAEGEVYRIAGVAEDITERRSLEEQFRQVQKMEAIGQLAGGIAHDFNNILAAIAGNLELALQDVPEGHPARESLDEIAKASRRAKNLVRRIVTFGRQQSDEQRVVSLGPVVEESVGLLRATLPAGIALSVSCSSDTPHVLADVTQVQQAILNLGTNAWHAMEGRTGRITVRLEAVQTFPGQTGDGIGPGRWAKLTISDTGVGMSAATIERIFEPFFTTKDAGHGTGLGLSVVHGIVTAHEGKIAVTSAPGRGSTFEIYLPAVEAETAAPSVNAPPPEEIRGRGQRILYLDDETALVELAIRQLSRLGYRVSGFTEAHTALETYRADPGKFDIAVTDFNMPGTSGLQVARDLLAVRPDFPVVLTSGYVTDDLREAAAGLGITVVYKPNTADELFEVVHRLVNARAAVSASH